jgi:hypothetical protein
MRHHKTMVKTSSFRAASAVLAAALLAAGCSSRGLVTDLKPESVQLARTPAGSFLSLAIDGSGLYAVYADPAATTLDMVTLPDGAHLPPAAPAAEIIDKVDVAAPLAPFFGENVLAVDAGTVGVLYLDRETDTRNVLKLAWKAPGTSQWSLDVMEPAGDPLALAPDGKGNFTAAWTAGLLSYRNAGGQVIPSVPPMSVALAGRPAQLGGGGFTAYDSLASVLLSLQWNGSGFSAQAVPGGSPVHSSLRSAAGKLRVLSWDPKQRRLLLLRERDAGGAFSTETVTVCDGTDAVALLPGRGDSSFLFLLDETRSLGGGRSVSQLSVIAPGSVLGTGGPRYRKGILAAGEAKIDGFAAARTADSLYVLLSQGDVRLLRIPLFP